MHARRKLPYRGCDITTTTSLRRAEPTRTRSSALVTYWEFNTFSGNHLYKENALVLSRYVQGILQRMPTRILIHQTTVTINERFYVRLRVIRPLHSCDALVSAPGTGAHTKNKVMLTLRKPLTSVFQLEQ